MNNRFLEGWVEPLGLAVPIRNLERGVAGSGAARLHATDVQGVANQAPASGFQGVVHKTLRIAGQERRESRVHFNSSGAQFPNGSQALVIRFAMRLVAATDIIAVGGDGKA